MKPLDGKVALVTGGSRGLGREICCALADLGAMVGVNFSQNETAAAETVQRIERAHGTAVAVQGDVTAEDDARRTVDRVTERFNGNVDVLVNNANGQHPRYSVEESDWEAYLEQLQYTVRAPLQLLKAVLGSMKAKGSGSIINIGSEVVQIGDANFSSYVTAKSAMLGMTRSWARELAPSGIRVNLVAPGFIPVERHRNTDSQIIDAYRATVPLGRMGQAGDVASAVSFFASDAAGFITGQCLSVNGGRTFGI